MPEDAATLDNIRNALDQLTSDEVRAVDRVFIYYSGHGSRVEVMAPDGRRFHREALVPADYDAEPSGRRMLFDHELNDRLRAITARTPSFTVVLDCCHAAGVTRFQVRVRGFEQELAVFVARERPVKLSLLTLTNQAATSTDKAALTSSLGKLCAVRGCSDASIRSKLTSFYSACQDELSSDSSTIAISG